MNRHGAIPRSVLILLLVALLAVGGLWLARQEKPADYTLGGPVFPVATDQIEGLLLTRGGLQFRFDRQPDGTWSLSGAADDYLDTQAMQALVELLPTVPGGALLPGTQPQDRRYDFNGPEAMRLRLFLADGRDMALSLGALNPVTGNYFASGAGRTECFPVAGPFRDKLFMLPLTVQAKRLLPAFAQDLVQEVTVRRGDVQYDLARRDGQWWLRLPQSDLATAWQSFPPLIQDYQAQYDDRRRQDEQGLWILAADEMVGQLIFQVSETVVRDIVPPRETPSRLRQWDLDPPWRQVVLRGEGLNPDPSAPVTDQYTISFGPPLDSQRVPALRRGNVLTTDAEALELLAQGVDVLVRKFALNAIARRADRLVVEREGKQVLAAGRTGPAKEDDGRSAWRTTFPPADTKGLAEKMRHGLSQDLVVNLNRVEILAVLPPTTDPAVLQDRERVRITLTWDGPASGRQLVLETGYLANGQGHEVGLWFPATGKLLQISDGLLVTARNLAAY